MKPQLSILLPAFRGYDIARAALQSWEAQTCIDQLEILILCPGRLCPPPGHVPPLPAGQRLIPVGSADLHEARAIGVRQASSAYVTLAEDHCLPDPDWAQAILDRLKDGWDAVGPSLRPGNVRTCWAAGSFLIGYGEWMPPVTGGPTQVLCGWNGTFRTESLRQLGPELDDEMALGALLVRRLQKQGHKFYLEDRAGMRHFDPPGWSLELLLLFLVGLGFGSRRTRRWSLPFRLLYPLGVPAIAFLHGRRAFTHYRRAGAQVGLGPSVLLASFVLAFAWALGEAAGSLLGTARVTPHLWRTEIKPVSHEDLDLSAA